MRRLALTLTLLTIPCVLAAQENGIFIYAVSPSGLPTSGAPVTILGENLATTCILPCPTTVTFDGVELEVARSTMNELIFTAPPHAPGNAAFVIRRGDGITRTLTLRYLGTIDEQYEKVLLPIWTEQTPGAFGSQWVNELALHNSGATTVNVGHAICHAVCPPVFPFTTPVSPGETVRNPDIRRNKAGEPPGRLIYFTANGAPAMHASLKLRDHVRDPLFAGTEIPVVREKDFFTTTIHIVDVGIDPRYRQALRVYEVDGAARVEFAVRLYELGGAAPIAETRLVTNGTSVELTESPGYAQILNLSSAFPETRSAGRIRIEIEPREPGTRFWAFLSVTHIETQRVTPILPH